MSKKHPLSQKQIALISFLSKILIKNSLRSCLYLVNKTSILSNLHIITKKVNRMSFFRIFEPVGGGPDPRTGSGSLTGSGFSNKFVKNHDFFQRSNTLKIFFWDFLMDFSLQICVHNFLKLKKCRNPEWLSKFRKIWKTYYLSTGTLLNILLKSLIKFILWVSF